MACGYHRTGILAALVNAVMFIVIVVAVGIEAVRRFQHPETVTPGPMVVAAAVGIPVNLYIAGSLRREGGENAVTRRLERLATLRGDKRREAVDRGEPAPPS